MKVIIDTNALMIPIQFNVDIFDELQRLGFDEFVVPRAVFNELDSLVDRSRGKDKMAAKVARSLADRCEVVDITGFADDVILELANDIGAAVLTNDIKLKKRLQEKDITVVYLRQKNRLATT
ncbi:MAG: DNA-binding protein [Gammaproteobacteria bacterium]|nr:DNA-binding protein [Gammaproteobacteria bacterium]